MKSLKTFFVKSALAFLVLSLGATASRAASITLKAVDASGFSSYTGATNWSNGAVPSSGNDYSTIQFGLRTPGDTTNYTFAGNSLTCPNPSSSGFSIIYKGTAATNTYTINNLTMSGGLIRSGSATTQTCVIAGNMAVSANSTIQADQATFIISANLSGSGTLTNTNASGLAVVYSGNNSSYTGEMLVAPNAVLTLNSTNALGSNPGAFNAGQLTLAAPCTLNGNVNLALTNSQSGVTLVGSGTVTVSAATGTTLNIANPIAGTTASLISKTGGGVMTLSGSNTFIGGFTLGGATVGSQLNFNSSNAIGTGTFTISLGNNARIDNTTGSPVTNANNNPIAWNNDLYFVGSSDLNLGTGAVTLGANRNITNNSHNLTLGGIISGVGFGINKNGAGTLTLGGASTYTGFTTVNGGSVVLTSSGSIAGSTNISVAAGATLDVSAVSSFTLGANQTLGGSGTVNGSVTDSSNTVFLPGGSGTVGTLTITTNLTLAGNDIFKFDFNSTSNDMIVVGGNVTPNGTTNTIINLSSLPSGGLPSADYVLFSVSGTLNGSAGNFTLTGAPSPSRQTFSITYNTSTSPNQVLLHVTGSAASLVWAPTNSFWDIVTTTNWLNAGNPDRYYDGDSVSFTDLSVGTNPVLDAVVSPGSVTFSSTGNYILTNLSGVGKISGGGGLNQTGSGITTIQIPTNSYTGATTLSAGILAVSNLANAGSPSPIGEGALVLNGGDLRYAGPSTSINLAPSLGANGGTLEASNAATTLTLSGVITGTSGGGLTLGGNGIFALTGANTYNGSTTVNAGLVQVSGSGTFGAGPITNNTAILNSGTRTIANSIAGSGTLTNDATGTLTLSGSSTFSGAVTINGPSAGGLVLLNSAALGNSTQVTVVSTTAGPHGGTRVTLSGGITIPSTTALSLPSSSGTIRSDLYTTGTNANNAWNGPITLNGSDNIQFDGDPGNSLTIGGNVTGSSFLGTMLLRGTGVSGKFTGTINMPNAVFEVTDGSLWQVAPPSPGVNSWSNTAPVFGIIQLGATNALPVTATNFFGQSGAGGALDLNGYDQQVAGLAVSNAATASAQYITNSSLLNNSTLTFSTAHGPSTFGGIITDGSSTGGKSLSLVVSAGSLTLTASNTYAGNTTINGGTLFLSGAGSITKSPVINVGPGAVFDVSAVTGGFALASTQTLEGSGSINGTVTVNGTITPGDAIGTITFDNSPVLNGTLLMRLDRLNSQTSDEVVVLGPLTNGGTLTITNIDTPIQANDTFTLFSATSYHGSFAAINLPTPAAGLVWNTSRLAVNGTITMDVAPTVSVVPSSTNAECSSSVTFTAVGGGTLPLSYQWYDNATNLMMGQTNATLTLSDVSAAGDGNYTVVATNTDGSASAYGTLNVVDTTPPVITVLGANPATVECHTAFTDPGATALDACVGVVGVSTNNPVDTNTPNTYTITYTATDGNGNYATNTRTVIVQDTTAPVISYVFTNLVLNADSNCSAVLPDLTGTNYIIAADACSGTNITITQNPTNGTVLSLGTNTVILAVADPANNTNYSTNTVVVADTTPPVITINGANPATVECHTAYIDAGATALDNCSGVVSVTTNNPVDPTTPNTYTVTYTATDGAGNSSTNTRTVIVQDTTPPVISYVFSNLVLSANGSCSAVLPDLTGTNYIIAADACSGTNITITESPTNGTVLSLGTNTVILAVADNANNTNYSTNTVVVADTTPPVITINGANPATVECHTAYSDAGASALDNCSGVVSVSTNSTVLTNSPGTYSVTYTATDGAGNSATNVRTVIVQDTTPPVITIIGANPLTGVANGSFVDPGATANDSCAGSVAVTTNSTVNTTVAGTYTIKYTASDPSGNSATNTRTVILQPYTIAGPYTADTNTLFLFHFDSPATATSDTNLGTVSNGVSIFAVTNVTTGTPPLTNTQVKNVFGAAAFAGFGTSAGFNTTVQSNYSLIFDGNNDGKAEADTNSTSLSADAIPLSDLNIGNGGQTPFTLEAMIWPTTITSNQEILCTDSSAGNRGFQFRINSSGQLEYNEITGGADVVAGIPTTGPNAYAASNWFHVAVTYDGTSVRFYWTKVTTTTPADNLIFAEAVNIGSALGAYTGPLVVGNSGRPAVNQVFVGRIDEVRISKIARAANGMLFKNYLTITNQPQNQVAAAGGTATFSVGAYSDYAPLSYQWFSNGVALANSGNFSGVTSSTLVISNVQASYATTYTCAVTNSRVPTPDSVTSIAATLSIARGSAASLAWLGDGVTNAWVVGGLSTDWTNAGTSSRDLFYPGDLLTFSDVATNPIVNLTGVLQPGSITFTANTSNYLLQGISGVSGSTGLSANGTAKVVLGGNNSYSGTTAVAAGTLQLTNAATIGPVLYLSFDDVEGNRVINQGSGGALMDGFIVGTNVSIAPGGRYGNALKVGNGAVTSGGVYINNPVVPLNNTAAGAWTVAMWVKSTTTTNGGIFYQGGTAWASGNTRFYFANNANDSGGPYFGGVRNSQSWETGQTVINDGNWHFVAMTTSPSNLKNIYVDGNLDSFSSTGGDNGWGGAGTGNQVWIGGAPNVSDNNLGLNGMIDEVYVFNRALSQAEIQGLMNSSNGTPGQAPLSLVSPVSVASGSKLDLNANAATITNLTGSGTVDNTSTAFAPGLAINNSGNDTFSGAITNTGAVMTLVKAGPGNLTLSGTNGWFGGTAVASGTLTITGAETGSTGAMTIGSGTSNATLVFSGTTLSQTNFNIGVNIISNLAGAMYQTTGTITESQGANGSAFQIGNAQGAYGYFGITGGTLNVGEVGVAGESGAGNGLMDINGGTVSDTGWVVVSRTGSAQTGVLNLISGAMTYAGGGEVNCWGAGQTAVVNVLGGSITNTLATVGFNLNESANAANVSILNLDGGLTQAETVIGTAGRLNFNGGTLRASAAIATFINGIGAATIYSGGGTVNNNGFAITIPQALLAPVGGGVNTTPSISSGGTGYIAPPIVTVVRGAGDTTGVGATAIAQINTATGVVTNVIITCPGISYTATPTFTLTGGGATSQAVLAGSAPTANTSGGLTLSGSAATTITAAATYTGTTAVTAGTLTLSGSGSIAASTNINVSAGASFNVSAISGFTLGASQTLQGFGTNIGSVNSVGAIVAGTPGVVGTNTFTGNLTNAGLAYLALSTSHSGNNGLIKVAGNLVNNATVVHISAPSTGVNLDTTADYTLMTSAGLGGSGVAVTPVFDVAPLNAAHFTVGTNGTSITLHYNVNIPPSGSGSASPSTVVRNQSTFISVSVVSGGGTITNVYLNALPIGGPSYVQLYVDMTGTNWTNTVTVAPTTTTGLKSLVATIQDNVPLSGTTTVPLTVAASGEVWDGLAGDNNWDSNPNWVSGYAPGYVGDSLTFDGLNRPTPNMDNNYSVAGLIFDNTAGPFTIGTTASTLTLTGTGVTNFSTNAQVLNVPIVLGAPQVISAAAGNLTLGSPVTNGGNLLTVSGAYNTTISGAVAGSGGLTLSGPGVLTLAANNTYTGPNIVSAGVLNLLGTVPSTANATVGTVAGTAVLNISAPLTVTNYLVIGNANNSVGAVYQLGGSVTVNAASGYDNLILGNVPGSYGYYDAIAGTTIANGVCIAGEGNNGTSSSFGLSGNGIMEVSGGTVNDTGWLVMARNNNSTAGSEIGILNVYSGLLTYAGNGLVGAWDTNETAIINVLGGTVSNTVAFGVYLGNTGTTGILNLDGGLLQASVITGYNGPVYTPVTYGQLNFNGGTLQPSAANANFIAVTTANVYSGGATINNNGLAITVAQPLLSPTGNGVVTPTISNPGSGYVAPPIVTVLTNTGDTTGYGATAIAQINVTNGTVTNIIITCPGVNYTVTPQFVLSGGGGSGAIITGNSNVANVSGGLTSTGAGSLTLTGVSTYAGTTTISNGTLFLSGTGSIASSPVINVGAGATFDVSAVTGGFTLGSSQTLEGSGVVNGIVTVNGTVAPGDAIGTLTFSNTPVLNGVLQMRLNRTNSQTADEVVVLGPLVFGGTLTVNNIGNAVQAGDTFTLFSASGYSGSFAATNLPALSAGLAWNTANLALNGTITVGNVPVITAGPTNATLECPGSITYNASATGSGTLSYTWTTNSAFAGTGASLTLNNLHVQAPITVSLTVSSIYGSATSNATITVVDTTAPVITVAGANPATVECHTAYTDPGATALDACAGIVSVTTNGTVLTNSPGTYTITYTANDGNGNYATNTRTVIVQDTTAPVITYVFTNLVLSANGSCQAVLPDLTGTNYILAMDACSGTNITITQSPTNGTVFSLGTNTVVLAVADQENNTNYSTNTVVVADTTPPVITVNGANPATVECHSGYTDAGASALDNCSGVVSVTTNNTVNPNLPNTYTVTYTATDGAGNSATNTRTVIVQDTTPPVITVLGANPVTNYLTVPFLDPGATALDACAGVVGVITNNPVDVNTAGNYTITYTATDGFNDATNTRTVVILPLVQPVITGQQLVGSTFQVTFTGPSGEPYDVLSSTDVGVPRTNWISVSNGTFSTNQITYTNTALTNSVQFYTIRAP